MVAQGYTFIENHQKLVDDSCLHTKKLIIAPKPQNKHAHILNYLIFPKRTSCPFQILAQSKGWHLHTTFSLNTPFCHINIHSISLWGRIFFLNFVFFCKQYLSILIFNLLAGSFFILGKKFAPQYFAHHMLSLGSRAEIFLPKYLSIYVTNEVGGNENTPN